MLPLSRRAFLQSSAIAAAGATLPLTLPSGEVIAQDAGDRPTQADGVTVLNPRDRVPMSFIIDDSTCLVNLAHFKIPQFASVWPDRYQQDWRKLPREIPDAFVRKFGEWCAEHDVKGKYSVVPYPALVGWVDRFLPGWTKKELEDSLELVRKLMVPNWDIHPEMVTHTWAIDTKTGRPYPERTADQIENAGFSVGLSVDQMTDYLAYALKILKRAGLPCEGVTTPGGFGNRSRPQLAQGTFEAVRDVYGSEIPHYFRDLYTDDRSVQPQIFYARDLDTDDPKCVVSVIGCTGDWFGGWDGLERGSVDQFITADLKGGRLPQVIDKGEPAILVCHWPGIYFNGEEVGFNIFKEVVSRVHEKYDNLLWMKLSEIARYWAAKELTTIAKTETGAAFTAPYGCPDYTVEIKQPKGPAKMVELTAADGSKQMLTPVDSRLKLKTGCCFVEKETVVACFDLPKGKSELKANG